MCVIAYKPRNLPFPEERYLENCFAANPDGAGFMTPVNGKVFIRKGLMTFGAFAKALDSVREKVGDSAPYVLHFRIATQGFTKGCTHPFPLTSRMSEMKRLTFLADVGIAHNGIIRLTSDGNPAYSDTMKFIADYMTLIADGPKWYADPHRTELIERLIGSSRLAVLDGKGHCELLGDGWEAAPDGTWYSNGSWKDPPGFGNWFDGMCQGSCTGCSRRRECEDDVYGMNA